MRRALLGFVFALLISSLQAQVVIDKNSMPVSGDTIRLRTANSVNNIDYTLTGANYNWDFSTLVYSGTVIDTFVSVLSTPILYNVAFSNPFDQAHLATVAFKQSMTNLPMLQISDGYAFMKNSTSQYAQVGVGLKISAVAIPMTFSNPEILYNFPVTYGTTDSSDAEYHASIATFGYYGEKRHRVNFVDGWGTLILPGDTFNVMRVKSIVDYQDTVYLDTIGFGFGLPRTETEYKWITPGFHEPVLQITVRANVATVKYFTMLPSTFGIAPKDELEGVSIYPNPVSDYLHLNLKNTASANTISIMDVTGKEVFRRLYDSSKDVDIPVGNLVKGIYFIRIENTGMSVCRKFVKE